MISTHPREGTKTTRYGLTSFGECSISTHPREGTKTIAYRCGAGTVRFQLTPARGRKRWAGRRRYRFRHFNSPPRGDENSVSTTFATLGGISTHPREGTKTRPSGPRAMRYSISTHPREGTKTSFLACVAVPEAEFQLTPARGRKHRWGGARSRNPLISTHPREGTKTYDGIIGYSPNRFQLTPARGRKHAL